MKLEKCHDSRPKCKAETCGTCMALTDTNFKGKKCPFYKSIEAYEQQVQALKKNGHYVADAGQYSEDKK